MNGPNYGNWVSMRLVLVPAVLGALFAGAAVFVWWLGILAGLFLLV